MNPKAASAEAGGVGLAMKLHHFLRIANLKYRADIDSSRALAVVPVILFHVVFEVFGGGVGVDIFLAGLRGRSATLGLRHDPD